MFPALMNCGANVCLPVKRMNPLPSVCSNQISVVLPLASATAMTALLPAYEIVPSWIRAWSGVNVELAKTIGNATMAIAKSVSTPARIRPRLNSPPRPLSSSPPPIDSPGCPEPRKTSAQVNTSIDVNNTAAATSVTSTPSHCGSRRGSNPSCAHMTKIMASNPSVIANPAAAAVSGRVNTDEQNTEQANSKKLRLAKANGSYIVELRLVMIEPNVVVAPVARLIWLTPQITMSEKTPITASPPLASATLPPQTWLRDTGRESRNRIVPSSASVAMVIAPAAAASNGHTNANKAIGSVSTTSSNVGFSSVTVTPAIMNNGIASAMPQPAATTGRCSRHSFHARTFSMGRSWVDDPVRTTLEIDDVQLLVRGTARLTSHPRSRS